MTRIKILGFLIFALSIALTFLSYSLSQENKINTTMLNTINEQKAFTQEISKNIFYIYTHKNASPKQLNASIKMFLSNLNNKNELLSHIDSEEIQKQSDAIIVLWNIFYKLEGGRSVLERIPTSIAVLAKSSVFQGIEFIADESFTWVEGKYEFKIIGWENRGASQKNNLSFFQFLNL